MYEVAKICGFAKLDGVVANATKLGEIAADNTLDCVTLYTSNERKKVAPQ